MSARLAGERGSAMVVSELISEWVSVPQSRADSIAKGGRFGPPRKAAATREKRRRDAGATKGRGKSRSVPAAGSTPLLWDRHSCLSEIAGTHSQEWLCHQLLRLSGMVDAIIWVAPGRKRRWRVPFDYAQDRREASVRRAGDVAVRLLGQVAPAELCGRRRCRCP